MNDGREREAGGETPKFFDQRNRPIYSAPFMKLEGCGT